jgi:hypothetical protein
MPWAIYAPKGVGTYCWRYATEKDAIRAAEKVLVAECNSKVFVMRITAVLSPQVRVQKFGVDGGEERGT